MAGKTDNRPRMIKNRQERRESLREELKSREYIRQIHNIVGKDWITLEGDEAKPTVVNKSQEYKGKCDVYLSMLRKTLPDIKSVEMKVEHKHTHSLQELQSQAEALGLDPETLFDDAGTAPDSSTTH